MGLGLIILFVYACSCTLSIIFTFSSDIFSRIEERLNFNIVSSPITPLDLSFGSLNSWLINNNRRVGPILVLLSAIDLVFFYKVIFKLLLV